MPLEKFGDYTFSTYNPEDNVEFAVRRGVLIVPGSDGGYDVDGADGYRDPMRVRRRFDIVGSSYADVDTQLDTIRKVAGRGRQLLRMLMRDTTTYRHTWAKCLTVRHPTQAMSADANYLTLPVTMEFEAAWPFWEASADRGYLGIHAGTLGSGTLGGNYTSRSVSSSPNTFTISNTGGAVIRTGYIEVRGAVTNPKLENLTNGFSFQYTGALVAASRLFIELATGKTWLNGAVQTYGLTLSGSTQMDVMKLALGDNSMRFTGTSPSCTLEYYWAKVYH